MRERERIFLPGEKIQLELKNKQGEIDQLASQITEVNPDGTFEILTPIFQGKIINLLNETKIQVVLPKGDAIYRFSARIIGKKFQRISSVRIEPISEVEKIQRRGYFRMKVIKEVAVKKVENFAEKLYGPLSKGTLIDLSGGGAMFTCALDYSEGDLIEIDFEIRDKAVSFLGVIRRKTLNDSNARFKHSYGIRFENITEPEKNEIAKFVFEEQRRLIKKGLI